MLAFLLGPFGRWMVGTIAVCAVVIGGYYKVKRIGWNERDTIAQQERLALERQLAELRGKRAEVTERVVVRYRDRVKVVREQGEEVIREVEKLVPIGSCDLPAGWRVLHDSAASGQFPGATERLDASPVAAQDAARTVAENYAACRESVERLIALQSWVREQGQVK